MVASEDIGRQLLTYGERYALVSDVSFNELIITPRKDCHAEFGFYYLKGQDGLVALFRKAGAGLES